ncbi:FRG domain-containing protein [Myxococcus sp. CA033]|uniref:FRG domain-containing protein n=1 Tax=Myxococcus sp. CA033 TaxID=2741516 RepID=UPI00157B90ED|nr:FRG domain-containing protein [Myxococcus sp. CA033]NTX39846.1 FRG domain-containing protein [Myxococcus sp. CA033]
MPSSKTFENLGQRGNQGMKWNPTTSTLVVTTPHALVQAVGYLKYARRNEGAVYFRGQNKIHPKMVPALYRNLARESGKNKREALLNKYIEQSRTQQAFLDNTPEYAHEPILQHYGVKTRWLDLVDNVWTALWFACQDAYASGLFGQYLHFAPTVSPKAFVVLMQAGDGTPEADKPGLLRTTHAEIVDLRRAAPSNYLRPHAQHGILLRRRNCNTLAKTDLNDLVIGTIEIEISQARAWLGTGDLVSTRHFFPPPLYDGGYDKLLKYPIIGNKFIGAVNHIGA